MDFTLRSTKKLITFPIIDFDVFNYVIEQETIGGPRKSKANVFTRGCGSMEKKINKKFHTCLRELKFEFCQALFVHELYN